MRSSTSLLLTNAFYFELNTRKKLNKIRGTLVRATSEHELIFVRTFPSQL